MGQGTANRGWGVEGQFKKNDSLQVSVHSCILPDSALASSVLLSPWTEQLPQAAATADASMQGLLRQYRANIARHDAARCTRPLGLVDTRRPFLTLLHVQTRMQMDAFSRKDKNYVDTPRCTHARWCLLLERCKVKGCLRCIYSFSGL